MSYLGTHTHTHTHTHTYAHTHARTHATGASPGQDPTPKGGGGGLYRPQKWLYRTMGFVGARGAGDFVLGIRQGGIFLFDPMCLYSKYSEFCGEFKNG